MANNAIPSHKMIPGTGFIVDGFKYKNPAVIKQYFLSHAHAGQFLESLLESASSCLWMWAPYNARLDLLIFWPLIQSSIWPHDSQHKCQSTCKWDSLCAWVCIQAGLGSGLINFWKMPWPAWQIKHRRTYNLGHQVRYQATLCKTSNFFFVRRESSPDCFERFPIQVSWEISRSQSPNCFCILVEFEPMNLPCMTLEFGLSKLSCCTRMYTLRPPCSLACYCQWHCTCHHNMVKVSLL